MKTFKEIQEIIQSPHFLRVNSFRKTGIELEVSKKDFDSIVEWYVHQYKSSLMTKKLEFKSGDDYVMMIINEELYIKYFK